MSPYQKAKTVEVHKERLNAGFTIEESAEVLLSANGPMNSLKSAQKQESMANFAMIRAGCLRI